MSTTPADQDPSGFHNEIEVLLDAITDYGIIKLDAAGNVVRWGAGAQNLLGYTAAEILGQPTSRFYTDSDRAGGVADAELSTARESGRCEFEGVRVRKDGLQFQARVVVTPIRDESGSAIGFAKVLQDVTEQREKEQRLRRQHEEIMELSTPVIQVWDKVLVLPLIGTLDSLRASRLTEGLLTRISETQAHVVIFDVSGVPTIDTQVALHLLRTVQSAALMGSASVLCGLRPETAQAMMHLGIETGSLLARRTLQDALQLAIGLIETR